jgi:peptidoglycan/LPS O-acetylase OafA/YrhL
MTYQAPVLDPGYSCNLLHVDYGPEAVFVFFVISGYVIGLTTGLPATGAAIRHYASRRLLRIVPIAWTTILVTGLLLRHNSAAVVAGNLAFLQNSQPYPFGFRVPVLYDDPPLWSLSFEMLYYAVFILIWKFAPRLRVVFVVTILAAFADFAGGPEIFARHAAYFVFWLCGLCIAWRTEPAARDDRAAWPASFFAAFAVWSVEPIRSFCAAFPVGRLDSDRFHFDVLLGSLLLLLAVTRRAPSVEARLRGLSILLGFSVLPLKLWSGTLSYVDLAGASILGLCHLARHWKPSIRPLALLAPVGLVSYALYLTAFPLMRLVYRCPFLPAGSAETYLLRVVIYGILCAAAAVFLERVMQPKWVHWLKALFRVRPEGVPRTAPLHSEAP